MMPTPGSAWRSTPSWSSPKPPVPAWSETPPAITATNPAPLLKMEPLAAQPGGAAVRSDTGFSALWPWPTPVHPESGLTISSQLPTGLPRVSVVEKTPPRQRVQQAVQKFWQTAPSDLKWLALALPIIIAVVLYSTRGPANRAPASTGPSSRTNVPKLVPRQADDPRMPALRQPETAVSASPSAAVPAPVAPVAAQPQGGTLGRQWLKIRAAIGQRAAIHLVEEFRSGLGAWEGNGEWARTWGYDPAGSVRVGSLALYQPSRGLSDYTFDFVVAVEAHGIGWVYRASDLSNYYATKLVIPRPGSGAAASVIHYAVVNGREVARQELPLPVSLRPDTFFQVHMDVTGNGFTTSIQGQVVDYWTDSRLTQGGVGFFAGRGEQARLRWLEILNHYDAIGRLCALIAPNTTQSNNGSSK